jgi:hypothetical protein
MLWEMAVSVWTGVEMAVSMWTGLEMAVTVWTGVEMAVSVWTGVEMAVSVWTGVEPGSHKITTHFLVDIFWHGFFYMLYFKMFCVYCC